MVTMTNEVAREEVLQALAAIDNNIFDYESVYSQLYPIQFSYDYQNFHATDDIDGFAAPVDIMINLALVA